MTIDRSSSNQPLSSTEFRSAAFLQEYFATAAKLQSRLVERSADIIAAANALIDCFAVGGKMLLCGNGGSAADCQHVAAELVSRLSKEFDRPGLPAIALTTDTSFLTAFANDVSFEGVFDRQVRALGTKDDSLVVISTSGNSPNIVRAVEAGAELGMLTVGLMGDGGRLESMVDHAIVVPSRDTQHVQEALLPVEHVLCYLIERGLFSDSPPGAST